MVAVGLRQAVTVVTAVLFDLVLDNELVSDVDDDEMMYWTMELGFVKTCPSTMTIQCFLPHFAEIDREVVTVQETLDKPDAGSELFF